MPSAEVPFVPSTGPACVWWGHCLCHRPLLAACLAPRLSSQLPFLGDKALDGYSKKKYVCKLLFIFLLGHDIDFGHMEAVNLLSSNRYTEKQIVSAAPGAWRVQGSPGPPLETSVEESRPAAWGAGGLGVTRAGVWPGWRGGAGAQRQIQEGTAISWVLEVTQ